MAVGRYETSLSLANTAAVECGLSTTSGLFASTDANFILLRNLVNTVGRELAFMHPWRQLTKTGSLTLAAASAPAIHGVNTLPADFSWMGTGQNGTFWNTTDDWELFGPVTDQQWEYAIVNTLAPFNAIFKFEGNAIWVYPPNATDVVTFKYQSLYWAKASGQSAPNLSACTADTDTVYFEPLLFTRLLKLRYLQARGRDTTAALVDFETTYSLSVQSDRPGRVLTVGGRRGRVRPLDDSNLPDTGYGS